jgi:hypothetical protein
MSIEPRKESITSLTLFLLLEIFIGKGKTYVCM